MGSAFDSEVSAVGSRLPSERVEIRVRRPVGCRGKIEDVTKKIRRERMVGEDGRGFGAPSFRRGMDFSDGIE